jgi:hypothetical protein
LIPNSPIDPERLAALLDGRLSDAEAASVRAQLADVDDDTLSAFADASAIASELGASETVVPINRRRRRWSIAVVGALAAAVLLAVVLVPRKDDSASSSEYAIAGFVSALPSNVALGDAPPWSVTRGGSVVSPRARAARLGVLLVHLGIAQSKGTPDTAAAGRIAQLVGELPTGAPVMLELQDYANGSAMLTGDRLGQLGLEVLSMVDVTIADAGAYLEAARIASAAGDVGFFSKHPLSVRLAEIRTSGALEESERARVVELAAMQRVQASDLNVLQSRIQALLSDLTR